MVAPVLRKFVRRHPPQLPRGRDIGGNHVGRKAIIATSRIKFNAAN
jgi:hypothetical protein